jgi:hypothetical protein
MSAKQRIVLLAFGLLIVFCAGLVICGNFLGAYSGTGLTDAALEGLKASISGLVGALAAILGESK